MNGKLVFEKLETTKDTVKVSWDGGVHFNEYDKTNAKANGIVFSEEQCPDITKIYVKGQAKTVNDIEVEVHANVAVEGSSKPYPIDFVHSGCTEISLAIDGVNVYSLAHGDSTGYEEDWHPLFGYLPRINYSTGEMEDGLYNIVQEWGKVDDYTYEFGSVSVCNDSICANVFDFIKDWALRPVASLVPTSSYGQTNSQWYTYEKSNYYFDFGPFFNSLSPIAEPTTIHVLLGREESACGGYNFYFEYKDGEGANPKEIWNKILDSLPVFEHSRASIAIKVPEPLDRGGEYVRVLSSYYYQPYDHPLCSIFDYVATDRNLNLECEVFVVVSENWFHQDRYSGHYATSYDRIFPTSIKLSIQRY